MRALAIFATASVLALPLAATAAPDCDGGRVYSLRLRPDRIRFHASLTRRGVVRAQACGVSGLPVPGTRMSDPVIGSLTPWM